MTDHTARYKSLVDAGALTRGEAEVLVAARARKAAVFALDEAKLADAASDSDYNTEKASYRAFLNSVFPLTDDAPTPADIPMPEGIVEGRIDVELHHKNGSPIRVPMSDTRAAPFVAIALRSYGYLVGRKP